MKTASIFVRAFRDREAGVWVATSEDIAGLAVEGDTHEALVEKVMAAVADLIELNSPWQSPRCIRRASHPA